MKTSELTGAQLDYWVAKAEGHKGTIVGPRFLVHERSDGLHVGTPGGGWHFAPSTEWKHGGPIMDRERIGASWAAMTEKWFSLVPGGKPGQRLMIEADTMLIAAMRAYVASKFGDAVPD